MARVSIVFLNVGQGDCTIAVDHDVGEALLIDCPRGFDGPAVNEIRAQRVDTPHRIGDAFSF